MPRASEYTQEMADAICERLAEGESLRTICAAEDMPHKATVIRWLGVNEAFRDQYARAREEQADTLAEEIIDIADESEVKVTVEGEETKVLLDSTAVARNRLRVDARKWYASKLAPKKYGDKLEQTLQGPGGGPVQIIASAHDENL